MERLKSIIESLAFASDKPLTTRQIADAVGEQDAEVIQRALDELSRDETRGVRPSEVAGGWQLRTAPENAGYVQKLLDRRPVPMSRAARETLAIIAYRQPITRAEVEEIRGVDCSGVVKLLLERNLIRSAGHREEPGRPLLYVTTREFLEFFHLRDLRDLPTLREFTELTEEHRAKLEALGGAPQPLSAEAAAVGDEAAPEATAGEDPTERMPDALVEELAAPVPPPDADQERSA